MGSDLKYLVAIIMHIYIPDSGPLFVQRKNPNLRDFHPQNRSPDPNTDPSTYLCTMSAAEFCSKKNNILDQKIDSDLNCQIRLL